MRNSLSLLVRIALALVFFLTAACEKSEEKNFERILFYVEAGDGQPISVSYSPETKKYTIRAEADAFLTGKDGAIPDSSFVPKNLIITINLPGDLGPSLTDNPNGYRVRTQIDLQGGTIFIDHTNQASLIISPQGDSLYAVRGEGIVSNGSKVFENITGFFYEVSTYKISAADSSGSIGPSPQVRKISCRYELIVDF
jgi:hypothetical protein